MLFMHGMRLAPVTCPMLQSISQVCVLLLTCEPVMDAPCSHPPVCVLPSLPSWPPTRSALLLKPAVPQSRASVMLLEATGIRQFHGHITPKILRYLLHTIWWSSDSRAFQQ